MDHVRRAQAVELGEDGRVRPTEAAGVGYAIDWDAMQRATVARIDCTG